MRQTLEKQKTSLKYAWDNKMCKGDIRSILDRNISHKQKFFEEKTAKTYFF